MSASRIQDGHDSNNRTGRISPGDLVVVHGWCIDEIYHEQLKNFTGLVIRYIFNCTDPALVEVLWTDGAFESMYEDELSRLTGEEIGIN